MNKSTKLLFYRVDHGHVIQEDECMYKLKKQQGVYEEVRRGDNAEILPSSPPTL